MPDLNGNGDDELVCAHLRGDEPWEIHITPANQLLNVDVRDLAGWELVTEDAPGESQHAIASLTVQDVNGDGLMDLIAANPTDEGKVLLIDHSQF